MIVVVSAGSTMFKGHLIELGDEKPACQDVIAQILWPHGAVQED
jgi:hypothetical protein